MDMSAKLALPYLASNQAQKHVTINQGFDVLDVLVQLSVLSATLEVQPADPGDGAAYILPDSPAGEDWEGLPAGTIACFRDGVWTAISPQAGWRAWDMAASRLLVFGAGAWSPVEAPSSELDLFGINTSADATNRLAVKSDAVLMSHDDVTPGSGDMRLVLNRADGSKTASVLFQSGYSGAAEFGLISGGNFALTVSDDGSGFQTAASFNPSTARASFPGGIDCDDALICDAGTLDEFEYTSLPHGLSHASGTPSNGYPGFGTVLTVRHSGNRTFQFHVDGQSGGLSIRANHSGNDPGMGNWTDWLRVWSEVDQGTGSGLAADRVSQVDYASLPSAAARGTGALLFVSGAPEGSGLAVSDGTDWHLVTSTTVIS